MSSLSRRITEFSQPPSQCTCGNSIQSVTVYSFVTATACFRTNYLTAHGNTIRGSKAIGIIDRLILQYSGRSLHFASFWVCGPWSVVRGLWDVKPYVLQRTGYGYRQLTYTEIGKLAESEYRTLPSPLRTSSHPHVSHPRPRTTFYLTKYYFMM